ncbi:MAG: phospho-N-acetylmuramoyl-pentapeptide-transferase [Planctomycetota bacterium]|nr:phospho-N-acetylmuramoyl-pentapeptide-transferase [Planctomycetota bacterium]
MFYQLLFYFQDFLQQTGVWPYANVFRYQTFRLTLAIVTSFFILMAFAPPVIRVLRKLNVRGGANFDNKTVDAIFADRAATPTMGGVLILPAVILSTLVWADIGNFYVIMGLVTVAWLGVLGGVDDYLKMAKRSRDGLRAWEKLVFQIALAAILAYFLYQMGATIVLPEDGNGIALNLPFYKFPIHLGLWVFMFVSVLVVSGTSNAVNLTDGMDGLAIGSMVPPTIVFLIISYIAGRVDYSAYLFLPHVPGVGELAIFCGALLGACLGFLWYNCSPAQVFMGDTGSLALGGAIGYVALATRQEALLLVAGGVFVLEALSVMTQVGYFKFTRRLGGEGRRIFRMSPLHYHFKLGGWTETQTVVRFWLLGAMFAALALATLKLR